MRLSHGNTWLLPAMVLIVLVGAVNTRHGDCRDKSRVCRKLGKGRPLSKCYRKFTQQQCCETCARLRDDRYPGCQYGDSQDWCSSIGDRYSLSSCYDNDVPCCQTCRNMKLAIEGCPYGDRMLWCRNIGKFYSASQCRGEGNVTCCLTCHHLLSHTTTISVSTTAASHLPWKDKYPSNVDVNTSTEATSSDSGVDSIDAESQSLTDNVLENSTSLDKDFTTILTNDTLTTHSVNITETSSSAPHVLLSSPNNDTILQTVTDWREYNISYGEKLYTTVFSVSIEETTEAPSESAQVDDEKIDAEDPLAKSAETHITIDQDDNDSNNIDNVNETNRTTRKIIVDYPEKDTSDDEDLLVASGDEDDRYDHRHRHRHDQRGEGYEFYGLGDDYQEADSSRSIRKGFSYSSSVDTIHTICTYLSLFVPVNAVFIWIVALP